MLAGYQLSHAASVLMNFVKLLYFQCFPRKPFPTKCWQFKNHASTHNSDLHERTDLNGF
jgi:hypothetical protein